MTFYTRVVFSVPSDDVFTAVGLAEWEDSHGTAGVGKSLIIQITLAGFYVLYSGQLAVQAWERMTLPPLPVGR